MTDLSSRSVALSLLGAVLRRRQALDDILSSDQDYRRLAVRDRAFARLLVSTTLRRLGQIDHLLKACLERPLPQKAFLVEDSLRLGIAQIVFLHIPAHAAVGETVELVRQRGRGGNQRP